MPELHYNDGGTWRKAKELHYNDGGTWRNIKEAWYNDGGTWRKVFSGLSLTLTIDYTEVNGSGATATSGGNTIATTFAATVTASGGSGSYTYSWAYVSGSSATVLSPSAASTQFRRNGAAPTVLDTFFTYSGVYRCTVTDIVSGLTATIDVTATTTHIYAL